MSSNPAIIYATHTRLMKSKYTKRDYRISISLPFAYSESSNASWPFENHPKKWPVVYLTDADWYFGMVVDIVRNMAWFGNITDAIIVGVGYSDEKEPPKTFRNTLVRRFYDLAPIRDEAFDNQLGKLMKDPVMGGGGGNFFKFIKYELIPVMERGYRIDSKRRILTGFSLGGVFTAFALLKEPELFSTYIIGSPALFYGDKFIYKYEEAYARQYKKLHAKVHLWVGEREESMETTGASDVMRLGAILEGRKYKGLILKRQIFPDLDHSEVMASGFQASLKWALKKE